MISQNHSKIRITPDLLYKKLEIIYAKLHQNHTKSRKKKINSKNRIDIMKKMSII